MGIPVEIWLRGDNHATNDEITAVGVEAASWSDTDVMTVLTEMLRALDRAKDPTSDPNRPIALKGFSWIVSPFESGVLIALELGLGAVVAGPFRITEGDLTAKIGRVMDAERATTTTVH
mgnify:FL=1|jgi:hypothetical protein